MSKHINRLKKKNVSNLNTDIQIINKSSIIKEIALCYKHAKFRKITTTDIVYNHKPETLLMLKKTYPKIKQLLQLTLIVDVYDLLFEYNNDIIDVCNIIMDYVDDILEIYYEIVLHKSDTSIIKDNKTFSGINQYIIYEFYNVNICHDQYIYKCIYRNQILETAIMSKTKCQSVYSKVIFDSEQNNIYEYDCMLHSRRFFIDYDTHNNYYYSHNMSLLFSRITENRYCLYDMDNNKYYCAINSKIIPITIDNINRMINLIAIINLITDI